MSKNEPLFCDLAVYKIVRGKSANNEYYIELIVLLKDEIAKKMTAHEVEKHGFSSSQWNNDQIERIGP